LQRASALHAYYGIAAQVAKPGSGWPFRLRRALTAIQAARPLVDDPGQQNDLLADERKLKRRFRAGWIWMAVLGATAAAFAGVTVLDSDYASNAPYRHAAAVVFRSAPEVPVVPGSLPAAGPAPPRAVAPAPGMAKPPGLATRPARSRSPLLDKPAPRAPRRS